MGYTELDYGSQIKTVVKRVQIAGGEIKSAESDYAEVNSVLLCR